MCAHVSIFVSNTKTHIADFRTIINDSTLVNVVLPGGLDGVVHGGDLVVFAGVIHKMPLKQYVVPAC
jgi:hypothetical protein